MKIRFGICVVCAICGFFFSGCTALVGTFHTQRDMSTQQKARAAGFTVRAFDPEIGGPSISADVGQIVSDLYANHAPSMVVANVLDAAGVYLVGKNQDWWGGKRSSKHALSTPEFPTSTGRDTILIQGNNNTLDTSTGHNTSDNHSTPLTP